MHPQCSGFLLLLGLLCFNGASPSPLDGEILSLFKLTYFYNNCDYILVAPRFVDFSPTSLIIIKGTNYYIETSAPKNWFNALAACEDIGYELISFGTVEKIDQVNDFLMATSQPSTFWTSGNDLYTLGKHYWYPSKEAVPASLWGPKQPDNANGVEHCDIIYRKGTNYTLKDENCNLARSYICEVTP